MSSSSSPDPVGPRGPEPTRRAFLGTGVSGLAGVALAGLLDGEAWRPGIDPRRPFAPRAAHHAGRAKRVLQIFCTGALSHVDTFDHKPELVARHGQDLPGGDGLITFQGENGALTRSPWSFRPRGECGKYTSDLLPRLGSLVDRMCFLHSMTSETNTHGPGETFMSTGFTLDGFPSAGAWVSYALGTENEDLPVFVAIPDPRGVPQASANNWGPGFLPAAFQGVPMSAGAPLRHLASPRSEGEEADTRRFLAQLNSAHAARNPGDDEVRARIASYELAARMQLTVPEATSIEGESATTRALYGIDHPDRVRSGFARNCLLARRLLERGVRYVQLFNGAYAMGEGVGNWDGHKTLADQYAIHGPILDGPCAALLADLEGRGLLEDTLVLFVTEFGRMPTFQKGASGRDHNPSGFTVWLAGAGVRAPFSFGATDEFGHRAVEDPVTVHDLYATVLHLVGLEHERLTYYHNGIERRLTDVAGHVIREILTG